MRRQYTILDRPFPLNRRTPAHRFVFTELGEWRYQHEYQRIVWTGYAESREEALRIAVGKRLTA